MIIFKIKIMRTQPEIAMQIEGLENQKIKLPEINFFGDSNWEPIDTMLDVLRGYSYSDYEDEKPEIETAAYDADQWLQGNNDEDLFE